MVVFSIIGMIVFFLLGAYFCFIGILLILATLTGYGGRGEAIMGTLVLVIGFVVAYWPVSEFFSHVTISWN